MKDEDRKDGEEHLSRGEEGEHPARVRGWWKSTKVSYG